MELTPENFQDFIERLTYHNKGEGVEDHCTANPIFVVQSLEYVDGIDLDYDPDYFWTDEEHEVKYDDDEMLEALKEYVADGGKIDDFDPEHDDITDHFDLYRENAIVDDDYNVIFRKIGYARKWRYVNAHFTREAAEAFIKRKKHDHRELRIWVDSQYWCPEFNAIVDGLLSGKIGWKE